MNFFQMFMALISTRVCRMIFTQINTHYPPEIIYHQVKCHKILTFSEPHVIR